MCLLNVFKCYIDTQHYFKCIEEERVQHRETIQLPPRRLLSPSSFSLPFPICTVDRPVRVLMVLKMHSSGKWLAGDDAWNV
jgi:hypothetical protein